MDDFDRLFEIDIALSGQKGDRGERGFKGEKGERGERGERGEPGRDGIDGLPGRDGKDGIDGQKGRDGKDGIDGQDGLSAYQIWLNQGNDGTEEEFVSSLKGKDAENNWATWGYTNLTAVAPLLLPEPHEQISLDIPGLIPLITGLTVANFASPNVSQWTNDAGYITSSSLTGYVPYTGATANLNLGAFNLIATEVLTDTVIAENLYFNSVPYNSLICTSPSSGLLTAVTIGSNLSFTAGTLSVTNAALTRTNDTNVTLTLGGTPDSALLAATSLTLGWTGTLAATRGGTGTGSYAVGDILYADTTTTLAKLADVATGNVLLSGGVGVAPSWGKVSASGAITGILPIANGGTNTNTQTSFGMCYYDGTKLTTSPYATLSFIAGDIDLLLTHPTVSGTAYEVLVTSSSCQYLMAYNTTSAFQGICGTGATENYWTLSTQGMGLSVSAAALWFGTTSNDDLKLYRNNTERLRLMTTGVYVPDVAYLSAASPTINAMVTGTTLIQSSVRLISAYTGAASANSSYFLGSGNDGGLLQCFGAGGTIASPTALTTDSRMGGVFGRGYAVTGYSNAVTAITFHAETTFTDTSTPTYIAFATTASGAVTRTERVRISAGGNVSIATTDFTRRLVVAGVGAVNDKLLYLRQTNDYGYSFNLDSSSSGRMYLYGVNAGVETSAIMTFDRTNTYVGVNATPSYRFHVNENQGYSSRNANPLPAQLVVQSGASGFLKMGNYYTGGVGTCSVIQSTDLFSGADHGALLLLNPLGGNVGIGEDTPNFALVARYTGTYPQISARYDGTSPSNHKELQLGYNGATGSGYGWIQAIHNGTAYTPLCLNPYGSYVGIGTLNPEEILHIAKAGSGTIGARILLENTASYATNNACEIGFLTDGGASVSSYNANIKAVQDGSGIAHTALTFGTYNGGGTPAERVRISPAGDVSIGIAASARAKLEVAGDIWTDWNDRFIGTVYQTGSAYKMGFATTTATRNLDLIAMSADISAIRFWTGSTPSVNMYLDYLSNVVLGNQSALATNATNGFVYIRTCAGTPTGAPTAFTGHVAMLYDTTNNKLYCYNGAWKSVTLT